MRGSLVAVVYGGLAVLGAIVVALLLVGVGSRRPVQETWVIPDGFRGLIRIQYERASCDEIPTANGSRRYIVPSNGVICTSSSLPIGEVNEQFVRSGSDGSMTPMTVPSEVDTIGYSTQTNERFAFVGTISEQEAARDQMAAILRGQTPHP